MDHFAGSQHFGPDEEHDAMGVAKRSRHHPFVAHAVLRAKDWQLERRHCAQRAGRLPRVVRLDRHEDDIIVSKCHLLCAPDGWDVDGLKATHATHHYALGVDGLAMLGPRLDEQHIVADARQGAANGPANGSGSDHDKAHVRSPLSTRHRRKGWAMRTEPTPASLFYSKVLTKSL